jgi:hypothetical protein
MPLIDLTSPTAPVHVWLPETNGARQAEQAPAGAEAPGEPAKAKLGVAKPAVSADVNVVLGAYGAVAAGAGLAIGLWSWRNPVGFVAGTGISVFAPLYILAQGIERLIEPFTSFVSVKPDEVPKGEPKTKVNKADALLRVNEAIADEDAQTAASWARVVDKIRRNTAVIAWAVASILGMILCGVFGLYMMRLVGFRGVPQQADIVLSGLAVGSGTKPLHDLISNVQKSKEEKEDPPVKKAA